jgi:hypothetical protein
MELKASPGNSPAIGVRMSFYQPPDEGPDNKGVLITYAFLGIVGVVLFLAAVLYG